MDKSIENGMRDEAWGAVVHTEGTRAIFAKRYRRLKGFKKARDILGLSIPLIAAFLYSTDWIQKFASYRSIALAVLTIVSLLQGIAVIVSLISSWDDEFAYSTRAQRDNSDLRDDFSTLAKLLPNIDPNRFSQLQERQKLLNSHDEEKGLTDRERQFGMRAGLIFCQRPCICGVLPNSRKLVRKPQQQCVVCGGN